MASTRQQLVIEGSTVTKVTIEEGTDSYGRAFKRETSEKPVEIASWLAAFVAARGEQSFTPTLAEGRILARKAASDKECVIVELPPAVRRILEKIEQREVRARQVAMPWTYLIFRFVNGSIETIGLYYRNERAESLGAEMSRHNMPNFYGDNRLCTGKWSGLQASWTLVQKLDWLVRGYFDSTFNSDLNSHWWDPAHRLSGHPQSFAEWEAKSKENPGFILQIAWPSAGQTVQSVLDKGVE